MLKYRLLVLAPSFLISAHLVIMTTYIFWRKWQYILSHINISIVIPMRKQYLIKSPWSALILLQSILSWVSQGVYFLSLPQRLHLSCTIELFCCFDTCYLFHFLKCDTFFCLLAQIKSKQQGRAGGPEPAEEIWWNSETGGPGTERFQPQRLRLCCITPRHYHWCELSWIRVIIIN